MRAEPELRHGDRETRRGGPRTGSPCHRGFVSPRPLFE